MDTQVLWLWLQQAIGVGAPQSEAILKSGESVQAIYRRETYPDDWQLTTTQRRRLQNKDVSAAKVALSKAESLGIWIMTADEPLMQELFAGMFSPPLLLYGKGERLQTMDAPRVAIVGTRTCDDSGIITTRRLAAGLAAGGAVIVTGGAKGLDSEAMRGALDEGGRCLSFQACGLDVDYPKPVAPLRKRLLSQGGTLLSEFPFGKPALRHHFSIRNRLISALADGTLVTQAPAKSGALLTASWAREQGRDVFAAPGAASDACNAGNNQLIKDGVKAVTCAADILIEYVGRYTVDYDAAASAERRAEAICRRELQERELQEQVSQTPVSEKRARSTEPAARLKVSSTTEEPTYVPCPMNASEDTKRVYEALAQSPQAVSELARALGISAPAVMSALTILELKGVVQCEAGQRYALRRA